jgi:hypothetical protein
MSYKLFIYIIATFMITIFGCQNGKKTSSPDTLDLMKYGVPYTINAPDDVKVAKVGAGKLEDISIKNSNGYDVQVFMGDAFSSDLEKLKSIKKEEITSNPSFKKIIEEFDNGFIYEKTSDVGERSYDFSIIVVQGDKEITFQAGNSKEFTEAEVKTMVNSINKN